MENDEPAVILEAMARIAGETLEVDHALIYDAALTTRSVVGLCEWLNPAVPALTPTLASFPLEAFASSADRILRTRLWLESHVDDVSADLVRDGADRMLHGDMAIKSLLWYPFAFREDGFYILVFNQVGRRRSWMRWEIDFLAVVAGYVSLALMKIRLLGERARALAESSASEQRYRDLVDCTPSMFFAVDRGGITLSASRFAHDHLGWDDLALVGEPVRTIFHPDDRDAADRQLAGAFARPGAVLRWELRKVRRDGSIIWVREAARVVDSSAGGAVAFIVCEDVTEQRRAEEAMFQAQKLESLGVLAGGIAHDFNNLLVGIVGNAELARRALPPAAPVRGLVDQISVAGRRAGDLAARLLAYAGKGRVDVKRLALHDVVREAGELVTVSKRKDVPIVFELPGESPVVEVDAAQLRQVVMNLVINAIEAIGPAPGTVRVAVDTVAIDPAPADSRVGAFSPAPGSYARLRVRDTGAGMDAETRARLFDPFFSTKGTGRGLGLAAVAGIVRAHHGAVHVTSEPGAGATFEILLPRWSGAAEADRPVAGALPRGSWTVLLVDDDPAVRSVTAAMLVELGATPVVAADTASAIRALAQSPESIACVVLDLTMPSAGGDVALRELRRIRPDLPVVLMSGYDELEAAEAMRGSAPTRFLQKPFTPDELAAKLAQVLAAPG